MPIRPPKRIAARVLTALPALWLALFSMFVCAPTATASVPCLSFAKHGGGCAAVLAHTSAVGEEEAEEEAEEEEARGSKGEWDGGEEGASLEDEEEGEAAEPNASLPARSRERGSSVLSHLRLTTRAMAALKHRSPAASAIGFSFRLSASTNVQVTLLKQTSAHGHKHWVTQPDSLTLALAQGQTSRSLRGHNRLSPGLYRLTLKPGTGHPCSIYLSALH